MSSSSVLGLIPRDPHLQLGQTQTSSLLRWQQIKEDNCEPHSNLSMHPVLSVYTLVHCPNYRRSCKRVKITWQEQNCMADVMVHPIHSGRKRAESADRASRPDVVRYRPHGEKDYSFFHFYLKFLGSICSITLCPSCKSESIFLCSEILFGLLLSVCRLHDDHLCQASSVMRLPSRSGTHTQSGHYPAG